MENQTDLLIQPEIVSEISKKSSVKLTEMIKGFKFVTTSDQKEKVIVYTEAGKEVWVNKTDFDPKAETITFSPVKKGDTWTNSKTGETGTFKTDAYQFACLGSQIVKKQSQVDVLKALYSAGFNPIINIGQ